MVKEIRESRSRSIYALWDARIDCACKDCGLHSSQVLYTGLSQANVAINKNMLHTLALYEPRTFEVGIYNYILKCMAFSGFG